MLEQAMSKARKLLDDLLKKQADLERHPPKISAANLRLGRGAMENAIASARRTVVALEDAKKVALKALSDTDSASDS